jgi:hypothetical protein
VTAKKMSIGAKRQLRKRCSVRKKLMMRAGYKVEGAPPRQIATTPA